MQSNDQGIEKNEIKVEMVTLDSIGVEIEDKDENELRQLGSDYRLENPNLRLVNLIHHIDGLLSKSQVKQKKIETERQQTALLLLEIKNSGYLNYQDEKGNIVVAKDRDIAEVVFSCVKRRSENLSKALISSLLCAAKAWRYKALLEGIKDYTTAAEIARKLGTDEQLSNLAKNNLIIGDCDLKKMNRAAIIDLLNKLYPSNIPLKEIQDVVVDIRHYLITQDDIKDKSIIAAQEKLESFIAGVDHYIKSTDGPGGLRSKKKFKFASSEEFRSVLAKAYALQAVTPENTAAFKTLNNLLKFLQERVSCKADEKEKRKFVDELYKVTALISPVSKDHRDKLKDLTDKLADNFGLDTDEEIIVEPILKTVGSVVEKMQRIGRQKGFEYYYENIPLAHRALREVLAVYKRKSLDDQKNQELAAQV